MPPLSSRVHHSGVEPPSPCARTAAGLDLRWLEVAFVHDLSEARDLPAQDVEALLTERHPFALAAGVSDPLFGGAGAYDAWMTRFVVCPATLMVVLEAGMPVSEGHQLVGPGSLRSQVLDLPLREVNGGRMTEVRALEHHDRLTAMKLRLLNDRVSRRVAWGIARAKGWDSVRDAEYLAIARLQADALVTIDQKLAGAAEGIVRVAQLEELQSPAEAPGS